MEKSTTDQFLRAFDLQKERAGKRIRKVADIAEI
jgi:hypothetical protein